MSLLVSGNVIDAKDLEESRAPIYSKTCDVLKLVSLCVKYDGISISPLTPGGQHSPEFEVCFSQEVQDISEAQADGSGFKG